MFKPRLPQIRQLLQPNEGYTFLDVDLERADAQIVAWEADEPELKHIYQTGVDIYVEEASWLYDSSISKEDERRQRMKSVVHAANYGGKERTLGSTAGVSTARMAEWLSKRWYGRFPGLLRWHHSVERRLKLERQIRNVWGFRRFYFDDPDKMLPQALAWLGQSSVAVVINKAMLRITEELPSVELRLQVHDSLLLEVLTEQVHSLAPVIMEKMKIIVPYADPLVIPVSIKASSQSWGEVRRLEL